MITALFWAITQRVVVVFNWRFGKIYRSHLKRSRIQKNPLKIGSIDCPETSVRKLSLSAVLNFYVVQIPLCELQCTRIRLSATYPSTEVLLAGSNVALSFLNTQQGIDWYSKRFSLCNAMKEYGDCRSTAPLVLKLDIGWRWVGIVTSRLLYPGERNPDSHWRGSWVGPRAMNCRTLNFPAEPTDIGTEVCLRWLCLSWKTTERHDRCGRSPMFGITCSSRVERTTCG
jgi:hypothetical protein